MQIPEIPAQRMFVSRHADSKIPAQRKFVSSVFHAHYNTHKAPKTLPHACLNKILTALQCSHQ